MDIRNRLIRRLRPRFAAVRAGHRKLALFVVLGSIASSSLPVWAQEGDPRVFQRTASQIRGVVQIRGCTPDISDINLRAVPLEVDTTRRDAAILDARAVPVQARLTRTSDGHRFNFLIHGLQPATPYQLSISVPPSPVCGTLFWRNDAAGPDRGRGRHDERRGDAAVDRPVGKRGSARFHRSRCRQPALALALTCAWRRQRRAADFHRCVP